MNLWTYHKHWLASEVALSPRTVLNWPVDLEALLVRTNWTAPSAGEKKTSSAKSLTFSMLTQKEAE